MSSFIEFKEKSHNLNGRAEKKYVRVEDILEVRPGEHFCTEIKTKSGWITVLENPSEVGRLIKQHSPQKLTEKEVAALKLEWFKKGILEQAVTLSNTDPKFVVGISLAEELMSKADEGLIGPLKRGRG